MRRLLTATLLSISLMATAQEIPFYSPYGRSYWHLHEGLNLQIDLGATIGFGRNNPFRNGAFHTDVSALYLGKGNDRLSYAGGLTLSHMRCQGESYLTATAEGILAYKLTDRLTALAFASVTASLAGDDGNRMMMRDSFYPYYSPYYAAMYSPAGLAPYAMPGIMMGGGLNYKVTENLHVGVSCTWQIPVSAFGKERKIIYDGGAVDYPVPRE